ncbi:MAG: TolC family protein [Deltaproteobacteria bacterium]|nr:TolC family protein [Deltaproteobacteria bacterium]
MRAEILPFLAVLTVARTAHGEETLTLEQAVDLARARSEAAQAAQARAEAASARVGKARALFFPDLTLTGSYTRRLNESVRTNGARQVTIQSRNAVQGALGLTWSLFDGRAFPLSDQAKTEQEAADLTAAETRLEVAFEAAEAFVLALSADQVLKAAGRRVELAGENLGTAEGRARAGLASVNDVTRAKLELAAAARERTRARDEVDRAHLRLWYLLHLEEGRVLVPPEGLFEASPGAIPAIAEIPPRLDVAAAWARSRALALAAEEPRRRFWPTVALTGQYRVTNEEGFSERNQDGFLGLQLTWVTWDGGDRAFDLRERLALAQASRWEAQAAARGVGLEVRVAFTSWRNQQEVAGQAAEVARIAAANAEEVSELYRQGLIPALSVADATARLYEAEVDLARARYGVALALLDVRKALGQDPLGKDAR